MISNSNTTWQSLLQSHFYPLVLHFYNRSSLQSLIINSWQLSSTLTNCPWKETPKAFTQGRPVIHIVAWFLRNSIIGFDKRCHKYSVKIHTRVDLSANHCKSITDPPFQLLPTGPTSKRLEKKGGVRSRWEPLWTTNYKEDIS